MFDVQHGRAPVYVADLCIACQDYGQLHEATSNLVAAILNLPQEPFQ